jgi:hypothetical protein
LGERDANGRFQERLRNRQRCKATRRDAMSCARLAMTRYSVSVCGIAMSVS